MKTLKQVIQSLFKTHNLNKNTHFDVWICGLNESEEIDTQNPYFCCHFIAYKNSKDGTDVFKWLNFEVEKYNFEIIDYPEEYHLFVKLVDINHSPLG